MEPFNNVKGIAAPLLASNIDTDVIMPKQFLKGIDRAGLDKGLFHDLRFLPGGKEENPDFILNRPPWRDARFLVVGPNFGCGSSREHAVWGMMQRGIRALIGTTFAGIFFDNCKRNGVLLIEMDKDQIERIGDAVSNAPGAMLEVNLDAQTVTLADGSTLAFTIDALRKDMLMSGLDAIGNTLKMAEQIDTFEKKHFATNPWLM